MRSIFRSFSVKVTVLFILLMSLSGAFSGFSIYRYSLQSQIKQLREKLMISAQAIALMVEADTLKKIPLNESGVSVPEYKIIESKLLSIRQMIPSIMYIYVMEKTERPGIFRFIIDLKSGPRKEQIPPALPGEEYNGSRFPEILKAFDGPSADKEAVSDEWGVSISGYAPIRDSNGNTVAILGVDMSAADIYDIQREIWTRALFILLLGLALSLLLGLLMSHTVTAPVKRLVEGTRRISAGDLDYQVKIKGSDEISELAESFNKMAAGLNEARKGLLNYFYKVTQSLVRVLEARDPYTKGHSDRVAEYSEKIAREMRLPEEKVKLLKEAALLHDIGKLGIQEMILNKDAPLSDEERSLIQRHPAIGEDILKPVSYDDEMLSVVRGHHERYDKKGYPDKLSGEDIGILAAIVAVADSYDAMTSNRAYRKSLTKEAAMEQLKINKGSQFNPKVVDVFLHILNSGA